jgi:8-oxo-dGTP pyrophosphatase MutT (NUDIX family)
MVAGELVHLSYLRFCHFTREYTANTAAAGMHMEHYLSGPFTIHREEQLQHFNHEIHRREVVIQKNDLKHRRAFHRRSSGLDRYAMFMLALVLRVTVVVVVVAALAGNRLCHGADHSAGGSSPVRRPCTIAGMLQPSPTPPPRARSRRFRPDVTVAAVVPRDDGRFLLIEERVRGELVLNQPAGHLEPGETLAQAAIRETLEEAAWEIEAEAFLGTYQWTAPDGAHFLRFAFLARACRHHAERRLDHGVVRTMWLSRDELQACQDQLRSPLVLRAVDDCLAGVRLPLDIVRWIE